jgi:phosphoribosyl-ATP pyrophosphohydrolase
MKMYKDVLKFNLEIIGLPTPTGQYKKLTPERCEWFTGVIREETEEFVKAWYDESYDGQIDAIIDLMYFAMGRLIEIGVPADDFEFCWDQVQKANMNKQRGNKGRGSDDDAIKPEGWREPKFGEQPDPVSGDTGGGGETPA